MGKKTTTDSVLFSSKGQIVIPAWLRKEFLIEPGTRAIVQATPDGILLKPVTMSAIDKLCGILKRKPGEKSLEEEWEEHIRSEKEFEDR